MHTVNLIPKLSPLTAQRMQVCASPMGIPEEGHLIFRFLYRPYGDVSTELFRLLSSTFESSYFGKIRAWHSSNTLQLSSQSTSVRFWKPPREVTTKQVTLDGTLRLFCETSQAQAPPASFSFTASHTEQRPCKIPTLCSAEQREVEAL